MGRSAEFRLTSPSPPWGRGWPATAFSSASAGRVRGSAKIGAIRDHFFSCELLGRNEATKNCPSSGSTGAKSRTMFAVPDP